MVEFQIAQSGSMTSNPSCIIEVLARVIAVLHQRSDQRLRDFAPPPDAQVISLSHPACTEVSRRCKQRPLWHVSVGHGARGEVAMPTVRLRGSRGLHAQRPKRTHPSGQWVSWVQDDHDHDPDGSYEAHPCVKGSDLHCVPPPYR